MFLKCLTAVALAVMLVVPALGDEKEKKKGKRKGQNVGSQLVKQLADVGLTEEQTSKIMELGKAAATKIKGIREAAGITPELAKKRIEVRKSMNDSEKKGKELQAAINEAVGFNESQVEGLKKMNAARIQLQKQAIELLTDAQKESLPRRMRRDTKRAGKKRKKDAS